MKEKHLALVRALPAELLPALRARALDPHTTKNTRPFGKNPSGGHLYIGRRIRTPCGKRKWEIYGTPAEVMEILDLLEGEKKTADTASNTETLDTVVFIPPPQPPISVTVPVDVPVSPLPAPDKSVDQAEHPLTTTLSVVLALLMLAPCLLYLANILSRTVKTAEQPVRIVPSIQTNEAFDHPYCGQNIAALTTESNVVKTVKDARADEANQHPATITKTVRSLTRQSQSVADIGSQMQSLEASGSRVHRLGLFFMAVEASAGVDRRKHQFGDDVPLTDGQIVEATGDKLFDRLGQTPSVLPKPLRLVWESSGKSAVAADLCKALESCVTAVAYRSDSVCDQLVFRTGTQRLADAFRAVYGVPRSLATWRDPDSGWNYAIIGTCVVITE